MRLYKFIENLSDKEIDSFLNKLDDYRDGLGFDYSLVKGQLGYTEGLFDKECLINISNINKGSIMDGYTGFVWNEEMESFYEKNAEYLNQYVSDYMESQGLNSFDELCSIISNDMGINWFLDDITLCNSKKVKRNIVKFFAEDVCYNVFECFEEYFDKELKE